MSSTFRLEAIAPRAIDRHVAELTWARLVRGDAGLAVECAPEERDRAAIVLTRAGTRVSVGTQPPVPPAGSLPAAMADLIPIATSGTARKLRAFNISKN